MKTFHLCDFIHLDPPYKMAQEEGIRWLLDAHVQSEKRKKKLEPTQEWVKELTSKIEKVYCKKEKIAQRGHHLSDFTHNQWAQMDIYSLADHPEGKFLKERSSHYLEIAERVFEQFYPENTPAPSSLIHVTCTGYNAPSAAQRIVTKRKWEKTTQVTHAYHMGCLGAFPALRIGHGFLVTGKGPVDIVHTEICSLHINPSLHTAEQLVAQSLFADGLIKYRIKHDEKKSLACLVLHEEMIPQTEHLMGWECEEWGFAMTLKKEIPHVITRHLPSFLEKCLSLLEFKIDLSKAYFAIHPGGPRIIELIKKALSLQSWQLEASEKVLYEQGNMSSATLPHIWKSLLEDSAVPNHCLIISLGFGPGLTIAGGIFKKNG